MTDVTAVARLLQDETPGMDINGDGVVDGPADPTMAESALRMFLTHVVLEHGRLWVAEGEGVIEAAAVFVPPTAASFGDELQLAVSRELHLDPSDLVPRKPDLVSIIESSAQEIAHGVAGLEPSLILQSTAVATDVDQDLRDELRAAVVSRELDAQRASGGVVVAIEIDPGKVTGLERAGFDRTHEIAVGVAHSVWIGVAPAV